MTKFYGFILNFIAEREDKLLEQRVCICGFNWTGVFSNIALSAPGTDLEFQGTQRLRMAWFLVSEDWHSVVSFAVSRTIWGLIQSCP